MTPPRGIRNFLTGDSWLHPDLSLAPAAGNLRESRRIALQDQSLASELEWAEGIDQFVWGPATRYQSTLVEPFRRYSTEDLEHFIPQLLTQAREGQRVSYYDALRIHYALLDRLPMERQASLTRRLVSVIQEYSNFLAESPLFSNAERLRYLFAASRIVQSYLERLRHPPETGISAPHQEELRSILAAVLDDLDTAMQGYYVQLERSTDPETLRLQGVMSWIALRRGLQHSDRATQRNEARSLVAYFRGHNPSADDENWQARVERAILEDPPALDNLDRTDSATTVETQTTALNGLALELLCLGAASLDRAAEEDEMLLRRRYQQLGAVLTVAILRHPAQSLDEILTRLRDPRSQADFMAELTQAESNSAALTPMLRAARGAQGLAELLVAARQAAEHLETLRQGLGRNLLPLILEKNRQLHPIHRVTEILTRVPELSSELGLPATSAAVELLRRGTLGLEQVGAFQQRHPQLPLGELRHLLEPDSAGPRALEEYSRECLGNLQARLESSPDHELLARYALLHALEENREIAPGLRVPEELRGQARQLRERIESGGFRARRVLGHLFSSSSLLSLGSGILLTEFLPTLLIARAGNTGRLVLGGVEFVSQGALTWQGSLFTGLGTGLGLSAFGSTLNHWNRTRLGLPTHWRADFLSSVGINLATFGATLPFSRWLSRRLAPEAETLGGWSWGRRLALHGGTVAFGGTTALGLGILGRGALTGQWQSSAEEISENFGSILLWETGSAGLRWGRGFRAGNPALGPFRVARVADLTARITERNPGLAEHREWLQRSLGRQEHRLPGTLPRIDQILERGGSALRLGSGRGARLLLVPETTLPPPPPVPASPVTVVILERPAVPRLSSSIEVPGESSAAQLPHGTMAEVPELALEFRVTEPAEGAAENLLPLTMTPDPETGAATFILGRENFSWMSRESRRVLSRRHLELRRAGDGSFAVRDLSQPSWGGAALEHYGTWKVSEENLPTRLNGEQWTPLALGETLLLGNLLEPVRLTLQRHPTPYRIELGPGERQRLNGLLLIRAGEDSLFRLMGDGNAQLEITRSLDDHAGVTREFRASENPIIGEIGEEVSIAVTREGQRREYRLFLDASDRPAQHLPEIQVNYHQDAMRLRFRATNGEIGFGKTTQPEFFAAPWISRRHFSLRIATHLGQPRYLLTADSRFGLSYAGQRLQPNQSVLLRAGTHELGFLMNPEGTAVDGPVRLHLPPIEGTFVEWQAGPLATNHDRGIAPSPPPLPRTAPPPTPPPPRATDSVPFWRRIFRR